MALLAAKSHVALIYEYRDWPDAGGLMSYGSIRAEIYRQGRVETLMSPSRGRSSSQRDR